MKNFYNTLLGVLVFSALFSSCEKTEGALYGGEANKISFFSPQTALNMESGTLNIPVGRTSSTGELSVPVTITATGAGYTNVFTMDGPVVFADGQAKSYAKVKYGDFSKIDPSALSITANGLDVNVGLAFPISLNISDDYISPSKKKKIDVLATSALTFDPPTMTKLNSVDGWEGAILDVQIQKAKGANVYKLISPFGANNIAFMIKSDGKTVLFPNQVIYNHPSYGPVSMSNVTGSVANGKVTLKVGGYTVSAGSFGGGTEIIDLP